MHSARTTNWMVNVVLSEAIKHDARRVARVMVDLGRLVCFNADQMLDIFETLFENTIAEGAEVRINMIEPEMQCDACGYNGPFPVDENVNEELMSPWAGSFKCPRCESSKIKITKGRECKVTQIGMVLP